MVVVSTGETPPDAATGAYFTAIQGLMDTRGRVLIEGTLEGTGTQTLIAHAGDTAPGAPGGATFGDGKRSLLLSLPETFSISRDGFETGNTSHWSSTAQ